MTQRLAITVVISKFPPEYSGPGTRIPRLYKWINEQGHSVNLNVICGGIEHTKNERYTHDGLSVQRITSSFLRRALSFLPKRVHESVIYQCEFIKSFLILFFTNAFQGKYLIHIAGHSGLTAAAILYANTKKIPIMMELVTEHARHTQKILYLFHAKPQENSIIIALTKRTEQACIDLGLDSNKIWQRPNPINTGTFQPSPAEKPALRKTLTPFSDDKIIITNVAKMMPQKNQRFMVDVMAELPDNYVCVLAGPLIKEGPLYARDKAYMDDMLGKIEKNNLKDRIHIVTDFVKADEYMKASDIYVMPAWNEGFGTPMIEAMGCALPVIANKDEYAFQEWVNDGENGYLCDINTPKAWAEAIQKAAAFDQSKRLQITQNIHKKAGQEIIYNHYLKLIKNLIHKGT